MTVFLVLFSIWYILLSLRLVNFIQHIQFLYRVNPPREFSWPRLSLVIPACNEAATIGAALKSRLSVDYPNLEVIVVNDRSTDNTGKIVAEMAKADPRLKVVNVQELPIGWLGKVHALYQGVKIATGEWLLFSDADVHWRAQSLKKAVYFALQSQTDLLAVGPTFVPKTLALNMTVAQFIHQASLAINTRYVANPERRDVVGIGAFNLVRRSTYDRSPGLESLKMEVLDDSGLGWAIKQARGRVDVLSGLDEVSVEWYSDFPDMVKGLEKNGFALFQYSILGVMAYLGFSFLIVGGTFWLLLTGPASPLYWGFFAAFLLYLACAGICQWQWLKISPLLATTLPVSCLLFPLIVLRSAVICLKQGGIYWRDQFYPLRDIKAGQRLRPLDTVLKALRP